MSRCSFIAPRSSLPLAILLQLFHFLSTLDTAMNLLAVGLALLSGVSATRLLQLAQGTQPVNVVLQINKATSEVAIDVWNKDKTGVMAYSCSHSLASGSFEKPNLSSPSTSTAQALSRSVLRPIPSTTTLKSRAVSSAGESRARVKPSSAAIFRSRHLYS